MIDMVDVHEYFNYFLEIRDYSANLKFIWEKCFA